MAQQSSQQQGGGDNSLAPVWITVLVFITAYFVWRSAHYYIVKAVFFLNLLQAKLLGFFIQSPILEKTVYTMKMLDPASVTWGQLSELTTEVGNYMRYPFLVILLLFAIMLYQSDITLKFKKSHNMKTLRNQEQHNWNGIMPVVKEDLVSMDINKGPWAMAMTPMEFSKKHRLLRKEDSLEQSACDMGMTAGIRKGDAKRVFTLQLGPYWNGFHTLQPHVRALAAVFMARICRDRDAAQAILSSINQTYMQGKTDFSKADAVIQKYQNEEKIQEILVSHAYVLTVMVSLLENARDDGVVSVAEFLWLKPLDRRLWYMLNCVGRQTPFVEVAGPFAHWLAEKAMKRRSIMPMIEEAIKALEVAVKEVKLKPKELQGLQP